MSFATANQQAPIEIEVPYECVPVALFGRCMLPNGAERPCQVIEISPKECHLILAHKPQLRERIVAYLDHLGRIDGEVIELIDGGCRMSILGSPRRQSKLADRIDWIQKTHEYGRDDSRRHVRLEPQNRNGEIRLADGRSYKIEIIDISLSGAAVRCDVRPAKGTRIVLSGMGGTVVRHFEDGIAMEFDRLQDATIA